ncbi:uncharacterized protein LOC131937528 isoform X1 [Physella acuta]|uniref:uncharacterized protein LOC131937528 isoform X1 n=2 Tax=Physella acuta TaxID=109671 RepID=UPI0027DB1C4F|nr:uncharacterized protein LOC131937528 isoform X1 [Physella acuta]XP_059151006.1 uncharacterized protein LOC131937528 isoform X1 [Physella acuta]XP_059151007.1 uncharacterized protein LOC131937528 isoform X1 [Physella acuta]
MKGRRGNLKVLLVSAVCFILLYIAFTRGVVHHTPTSESQVPDGWLVHSHVKTRQTAAPLRNQHHTSLFLHKDVNIVPSLPPHDFVLPKEDCVPLPKSPKADVKICIYKESNDTWVSGKLKKNELWEEMLVLSMDQALKNGPELMLVDLGANLGEFTLWAAALGHRVLAVEMVLENVHMLQTSLMLSGLSQLVTIVNNALYSDHRTLQVNFMKKNMGGSRLNTSNVFEALDNTRGVVLVNTICLDDLIPLVSNTTVYMKLDIENTEHEALKCADHFFSKVNVKVVQMEWYLKTSEEMSSITRFMVGHGYVMSESVNQIIPVTTSDNVYFLKKTSF